MSREPENHLFAIRKQPPSSEGDHILASRYQNGKDKLFFFISETYQRFFALINQKLITLI